MDDKQFLARQFEAERDRLKAVAYRMLGSLSEADDAVQEAWLRLHRADASEIANLSGWLTTVLARVCLDRLRTRQSRREEPLEKGVSVPGGSTPEQDILLDESVGLAMLVVLDRLAPAERVAFVLHDIFDLPFDEIAPVVGRSLLATRQLASRARRRVRGGSVAPSREPFRQVEAVNAFLVAARGGSLEALVAVLDPDVLFRADPAAARLGSMGGSVRGAAVANFFHGRAQGARMARINGVAGLLVGSRRKLFLALTFQIQENRIVGIDAFADPKTLRQLQLSILGNEWNAALYRSRSALRQAKRLAVASVAR
jgi:RNA polymerase sigma-70 factor (ECF subfamily)